MRRTFGFAGACAAAIGTAWAIGMALVSDPLARRALGIAAVLAIGTAAAPIGWRDPQ